MTDLSPMLRIMQAIAAHTVATEAGHLAGPPPGTPRRLVRLVVVEEGEHWVLLAVDSNGWEYRTRLAPGEVVELLPADHRLVAH